MNANYYTLRYTETMIAVIMIVKFTENFRTENLLN